MAGIIVVLDNSNPHYVWKNPPTIYDLIVNSIAKVVKRENEELAALFSSASTEKNGFPYLDISYFSKENREFTHSALKVVRDQILDHTIELKGSFFSRDDIALCITELMDLLKESNEIIEANNCPSLK